MNLWLDSYFLISFLFNVITSLCKICLKSWELILCDIIEGSNYHISSISKPNTIADCEQAIDAVDNGINQYDTDQSPRYVNNTHLSSRVGRLNLDWIEPDQSSEKENEAFERAMDLAGSEFLDVRLS